MNKLQRVRVAVWTPGDEDRDRLLGVLARIGCEPRAMDSSKELLHEVRAQAVDLIIATISPSFAEPLHVLAHCDCPLPPVLVLTDTWDTDLYLQAVRLGAFDAFGVPIVEEELMRIIWNALLDNQRRVA